MFLFHFFIIFVVNICCICSTWAERHCDEFIWLRASFKIDANSRTDSIILDLLQKIHLYWIYSEHFFMSEEKKLNKESWNFYKNFSYWSSFSLLLKYFFIVISKCIHCHSLQIIHNQNEILIYQIHDIYSINQRHDKSHSFNSNSNTIFVYNKKKDLSSTKILERWMRSDICVKLW